MRPTLDGLNADQWFTVARALAETTLLCVALWFVGRTVLRGFRELRELRRQEREMEERRRWWSEASHSYVQERNRGLVSETPCPWPVKGVRNGRRD